MKKISLLLTLCIAIGTISCDKEPSRALLGLGKFRVDIDGQQFESDRVNTTIIDNKINITALGENGEESIVLIVNSNYENIFELGLEVNGVTNLVTYTLENNSGVGSWVSITDSFNSQGTVLISKIDRERKVISGSFSFTGTNPSLGNNVKEFTEGSFSELLYTGDITDVPPPDPTNTFSAKIDGNEFVEDKLQGTLGTSGALESVTITATQNDVSYISLIFPRDITPGDYDFGLSGAPSGQYNILMPNTAHIADGSFTITSHDIASNRIIGTFSFIAKEFGGGATGTYDVTEGNFDITY